ncbi:MAG: hypothetical protein JWR24_738 [Actinoallomurus sp.]|jgi:hypothetical protein|nr:hypothetical protein [Actinoallomurus sp.]
MPAGYEPVAEISGAAAHARSQAHAVDAVPLLFAPETAGRPLLGSAPAVSGRKEAQLIRDHGWLSGPADG